MIALDVSTQFGGSYLLEMSCLIVMCTSVWYGPSTADTSCKTPVGNDENKKNKVSYFLFQDH